MMIVSICESDNYPRYMITNSYNANINAQRFSDVSGS